MQRHIWSKVEARFAPGMTKSHPSTPGFTFRSSFASSFSIQATRDSSTRAFSRRSLLGSAANSEPTTIRSRWHNSRRFLTHFLRVAHLARPRNAFSSSSAPHALILASFFRTRRPKSNSV